MNTFSNSLKAGFRAVPIRAQAGFQITNQVREINSANVVAKILGSDAKLKDEYVVYSGHWDYHGQVGNQISRGKRQCCRHGRRFGTGPSFS